MSGTDAPPPPDWLVVSERLEALATSPTEKQIALARLLGIELPSAPAPVAAVILQHQLRSELFIKGLGEERELPGLLAEIEDELGIGSHAALFTGTGLEVRAWFQARYMQKTVRGLRELKPEPGDVVALAGGEMRVVSSIGKDGQVHLKNRPRRSAWPNNLSLVKRRGAEGYEDLVGLVRATLLNAATAYAPGADTLRRLDKFLVSRIIPANESIRKLEDLLQSGERREEEFQKTIKAYPELLASTVVGSWARYVIPKKKLGSEYVTDFLVLGVDSAGLHWVAVEIEGAHHRVLNKDRTLAKQTRHAVQQIQDWRRWLTTNVAYAHSELGLSGITNKSPGLVIIGRGDPSFEQDHARDSVDHESRIGIHSWDWLLRHAEAMRDRAIHVSDFALEFDN
ncbi:MAG: DUF4263 domain-containing protein [Propionibacteriaceae bacterium]|nr:DUF4263 domain-containing protein [Propionibacteriaceae bacterium]